MLILEDYYRTDKKQTRIKFYERYVEEKQKLLNNYKLDSEKDKLYKEGEEE